MTTRASRASSETRTSSADFERLVHEHGGKLHALLLRLTRNPADADELLQDVFMTAFAKFKAFRGESSVYTWLYAIARNAALMRLRKRTPVLSALEGLEEPARGATAENSVFLAQVGAALRELRVGDREILLLRVRDELGHSQIAAQTKSTVSAVKARLFRAREHLRRRFAA